MTKEGIVSKVENEIATVLIKTQNACDVCRAECGGHCDKARLEAISVENTLGAKVGDRVLIYSETKLVMGYALLVFVLPIILAFASAAALSLVTKSPLILALAGLLSFIFVFLLLHFAFRKKREEDIFKMSEILQKYILD